MEDTVLTHLVTTCSIPGLGPLLGYPGIGPNGGVCSRGVLGVPINDIYPIIGPRNGVAVIHAIPLT